MTPEMVDCEASTIILDCEASTITTRLSLLYGFYKHYHSLSILKIIETKTFIMPLTTSFTNIIQVTLQLPWSSLEQSVKLILLDCGHIVKLSFKCLVHYLIFSQQDIILFTIVIHILTCVYYSLRCQTLVKEMYWLITFLKLIKYKF
jgi:hypothetical protein